MLRAVWRLQVIVAPHVLPPSISGNNATGQALFTRLSTSFGYLNYQGFCANIAASYNCKNFPVMIGSFGSALTSPLDVQFMNDLSDYLANAGEWWRQGWAWPCVALHGSGACAANRTPT